MIHKLPWKAGGPKEAIEFEIAGVYFQVRPTRIANHYLVACVDCDCSLDRETVVPALHIKGHLAERHGFKGSIVAGSDN